jgi:hypothetical protein
LSIPVPCGEDWGQMTPVERGRHCQRCCKTVVDFTEMSDAEVLRYISENVGAKVCGRLMPDQLGRQLAPAPVQRNGWKGWNLVLAGALVMGKGPESAPGSAPPLKAGVEARWMNSVGAETVRPWIAKGGLYTVPVIQQGDVKVVPDTAVPWTGGIAVSDTHGIVSPDTVRAAEPKIEFATKGQVALMGDTVLCTRNGGKDSVSIVVDSVGVLMKEAVDSVKGVVDSVKGVVDSVRRWGMTVPKPAVTVYPNPVVRGGMMRLVWSGEAGTYSVAFLDLRRQMTEEKVIVVGAGGQVDEWAVPKGLAAGVYFFRVARMGERAATVEVLIQ